MDSQYRDRWIECSPDGITIRAYYFPWGSKKIPYRSIRSLRRVELSTFRGQARIWGTANPRYWANLDPGRPRKSIGLIVDLGRRVQPFLTPDDPGAVEAIIREKAHLGPDTEGTREGPLI
ncbi:MAG: hypothetical protein ABSD97_11875 [Acidimicrobiales bacterium]